MTRHDPVPRPTTTRHDPLACPPNAHQVRLACVLVRAVPLYHDRRFWAVRRHHRDARPRRDRSALVLALRVSRFPPYSRCFFGRRRVTPLSPPLFRVGQSLAVGEQKREQEREQERTCARAGSVPRMYARVLRLAPENTVLARSGGGSVPRARRPSAVEARCFS